MHQTEVLTLQFVMFGLAIVRVPDGGNHCHIRILTGSRAKLQLLAGGAHKQCT